MIDATNQKFIIRGATGDGGMSYIEALLEEGVPESKIIAIPSRYSYLTNFQRISSPETRANLFISCDHAGYSLANALIRKLSQQEEERDIDVFNVGTNNADFAVDYPQFSQILTYAMTRPEDRGILICGTGIGMSIAANRASHIRAALCYTPEVARLARAHNDANVLCLAGRILSPEIALEIVDTFLTTAFEGNRHQTRVEMINQKLF